MLLALIGFGIFCINYICFYSSTKYIASGLVCVIFSLISIFNTIFAGAFLGKQLTIRHFQGISLGILGISIIFYPDIVKSNLDVNLLKGISYTLLETIIASGAQTLIAMSMKKGVKTLPAMTISMGYGAFFNILIVLFLLPIFL